MFFTLGMQYPFSANNPNADGTRNNVKSNNTENQQRDSKENNGEINPKSVRPRDTGKSDDKTSNGTFAMNNDQGPKKQQNPYISESAIVTDTYTIKYPQGMITSNGKLLMKYINYIIVQWIMRLNSLNCI